MLHRLSVKSAGVALICFGSALSPLPAFAGFEWVAPTETAQQPPAIIQAPAPVITGARSYAQPTPSYQDVISPIVITGSDARPPAAQRQATQMPVPLASGVPDGEEIPVYKGVAPEMVPSHPSGKVVPTVDPSLSTSPTVIGIGNTTVPGAVAPSPGAVADRLSDKAAVSALDAGEPVRGFAKGVPLVVALRQILPAGYAFSVEPNVDMGALISFKGGRPWRDTLREALVPAGLAMREQGQMVTIAYASDKAALAGNSASASAAASSPNYNYQPGMAPQNLAGSGASMSGMSEVPAAAPATVASPMPMSSGMGAPTNVLAMSATPVGGAPANGLQMSDTWEAERGASLHRVLEEWCHRSHVEFDWLAEYDYPIQASVNYSGTFEDAVRNILVGFEGAHPQPVAELHANSAMGQSVLVVTTRGNSSSD